MPDLIIIAAAEAESFTASANITSQPLVGQSTETTPPTITGGSLTYQWYDGDPASVGVSISGATSLDMTPTEAEYGSTLYLRATITGQGVTSTTAAPAKVARLFVEDWSGLSNGDTWAEIDAENWDGNSGVLTGITTTTGSPLGKAATLAIPANGLSEAYRSDAYTFLAANQAGTDFVESLTVIHLAQVGERFFVRTLNSGGDVAVADGAGVALRLTAAYHQLPGDDPVNNDGTNMGLTLVAGETYAIRHRVTGALSQLKVWNIDSNEPLAWSERTHSASIPVYGVGIGARFEIGSYGDQVWYHSLGCNIAAAADDLLGLIPPSSSDAYEASAADTGVSSISMMDGLIIFSVEDL